MLRNRFVFKTFANTFSNTIANTAAAVAVAVVAPRFCSGGVKSNDPTYEDDRWLEAELATTPEMTVEERYARQKQHELMKKLLKNSRDHTEKHVEKKAAEHKAEIEEMKKQMAALQEKLSKAEKE